MPSRRPPAPLLSSGGLAPRHTEAGRTRRPTPLILLLFACRSVAVETEACVIQTDRLTRTRTEGRIVELLEVRHGVHRGLGLGDRSHALGGARIEELDHMRQTLRDVIARHTNGVEGAHRQLGAGLANGLGGDDADRLADVDHLAGGQGSAVAGGAGADLGVAGQNRTDPDLLDPGRHECADDDVTQVDAGFGQQRSVVLDVLGKRPRVDARLDVIISDQDALAVLLDDRHEQPTVGSAVFLTNDDILRDIHQTTGQVTRVGGTQRGVGQTLSGAVRRDEELQDGQTLTEVRLDRARDDLALGVGHQATHAGDLTQLHPVTARARGHHPVDGVGVREIGFHLLGDLVGRLRPDLDELLTTLVVGDQTTLVLGLNLGGLGLVALKDLDLARRRDDVGDGDRGTRTGGPREAGLLQRVQRGRNLSLGVALGQVVDDQRQPLLVDLFVDERVVQRQRLVEERPTQGGLDGERGNDAVLVCLDTLRQGHAGWRDDVLHPDLDRRAQLELVGVERHPGLRHGGERTTGAFAVLDGDRQEVDADDHVLGGHGHRTAIGRLEDVVARQHQDAGFGLGLCRQRQVHSHLVTVEVGVEGRTDQRVDLDGLALDELRLEGLDAEAVQRRRTVEQNRVFGDDLFEDVPHVAIAFVVSASPLDHALGALDVLSVVEVDQPLHHERFEELQGHLLGQTTLVQLQLRTDDDDRTAGVVDALAEEVLAEATLLALEHVGERFQRTVAGARDRATTTAVVEERVHSLLQHALLVVDDDLGRAEVEQSLEPVVAVDHATVKVVQVGGGEAATIELDHRPQVRRNDRNAVQDHAGRVVAGHLESSDDAQTLERAGLLLALAGRDDLAQHPGLGVEVEGVEALLQRRGTHRALEVQPEAVTHLAVEDLVALEVLDLQVLEPVPDLLETLDVLVRTLANRVDLTLGTLTDLAAHIGLGAFGLELGQVGLKLLGAGFDVSVATVDVFLLLDLDLRLERRQVTVTLVGVDRRDHVGREVDDLLQVLRSQVEQVAQTAGNTFEVPDVGDRSGELDVAHPLATHLRAGHLDATALTDDALEADPLVLAAVALPVAGRTKDLLAEETVLLRFQGPVVDGLRLLHLAMAPLSDVVRGRQANAQLVEEVDVEHVCPSLAKNVKNGLIS